MLNTSDSRPVEKVIDGLREVLSQSKDEARTLTQRLRSSDYSTENGNVRGAANALNTDITQLESQVRQLRLLSDHVPTLPQLLDTGFATLDAVDEALDKFERHLQSAYGIMPVHVQVHGSIDRTQMCDDIDYDEYEEKKEEMMMPVGRQERRTEKMGKMNVKETKQRSFYGRQEHEVRRRMDNNSNNNNRNTVGARSYLNSKKNNTNIYSHDQEMYNNSREQEEEEEEEEVVGEEEEEEEEEEETENDSMTLPKTPRLEDFGLDVKEIRAVQLRVEQGKKKQYGQEQVDTSGWNDGEAGNFNKKMEESMRKIGIDLSQHQLNERYDEHRHKALRHVLACSTPSVTTNLDVHRQEDYPTRLGESQQYSSVNPNRALLFDEDED